jgi:hypothetical protein
MAWLSRLTEQQAAAATLFEMLIQLNVCSMVKINQRQSHYDSSA